MAKKIKFTQKEIKSPDKFRQSVTDAIEFTSDNYKKVLLAAGGVIIIIIAIMVTNIFYEKRELQANAKLREAIELYSNKDLEQALNDLTSIKEEYPQVDISKIVNYYMGLISYDIGNYDETIDQLTEFVSSGVSDQILIDSANLTMGMASYNIGEWQQAIDYLSMVDRGDGPYGAQAKLLMSLSLEKQGKISEAEDTYREVLFKRQSNNINF
ncbi:hypothetical protein MYX76_14795 [Desulfobacterota bacterium AH_259_B03_O07]|nr:hypothetical protein [Desulfobacterota bacterium AH_259_B03_O07]